MKFKKYINEMMSHTTVGKPSTDAEILREAIVAELDATNLYEQMARQARDYRVRRVLLDVAHEEKVHVGEFEELLEKIDPSFESAEEEAEEELEDMGISESSDTEQFQSKIKKFFIDNPNPSDKQVHSFAKKLGIDEHKFEEHIYKLLSSLLKK